MLKNAIYSGLHGPISQERVLTRIERQSSFALLGMRTSADAGGATITLLHTATGTVHTLVYSPGDHSDPVRVVAVMAAAGVPGQTVATPPPAQQRQRAEAGV